MELGVYTFAELSPDPVTGQILTPEVRMRNLMEEVELADRVGLDVFGIGEHHRKDFVVSSPAVALAAASQRTERIRLSSAVNVLSSDDPVRVFQQFATLDLLSGGRAEIMAGRGSFIESFPLFGYQLKDYDELFSEKLGLLLKIRESEIVTWSGRHRPAINGLGVYPRPLQNPLPIWIAVGGTPESVARAATLGLPMGLAFIGGSAMHFAALIKFYRDAAREAGHNPDLLPIGMNIHGYIADTTERAIEEFYPSFEDVMNRIGRERGWPPSSRKSFDASRGELGALVVGSPRDVAEKLIFLLDLFGNQRFMIQFSVGTMPHEQILRSIELYGTEVAPLVRGAIPRG